jgi:hypothetical protein
MIGKVMQMRTMIRMDSRCSVRPLPLSPILRLDSSWRLRLAVFPVSLACIIVDVRTRSARVA